MTFFSALVLALFTQHPAPRDSVWIQTPIFLVQYSETKEQPLRLLYRSTNRPKNVQRGRTDFHTEKAYHTSDAADYVHNQWDKGHLAPAASFSDSWYDLLLTFSYLNSALQQQDLNRGAWARLESQERKWDDKQTLMVDIIVVFSDSSKKLPTGATVPDGFHKHITFERDEETVCWYFPNAKPTRDWTLYQEADCNHGDGPIQYLIPLRNDR